MRVVEELLSGGLPSHRGVVKMCKYEDMPQAVTADGSVVVPDMVVAMSSITCRQTNDQPYETHESLDSVKSGTTSVAGVRETANLDEQLTVMKGTSGKMYTTCKADGAL